MIHKIICFMHMCEHYGKRQRRRTRVRSMSAVCINNSENYVKMVNVWMSLVVHVVAVCNTYVSWMFVWLYGTYVYSVTRDRHRTSGKNFRKSHWRTDRVPEIKWLVHKLKMFHSHFYDKPNATALKHGAFQMQISLMCLMVRLSLNGTICSIYAFWRLS